MNHSDFFAHAKIILETPQAREMCQDCGAVVAADAYHLCDPEERTLDGMTAAWRSMLGGKSPKDRARGYAVQ